MFAWEYGTFVRVGPPLQLYLWVLFVELVISGLEAVAASKPHLSWLYPLQHNINHTFDRRSPVAAGATLPTLPLGLRWWWWWCAEPLGVAETEAGKGKPAPPRGLAGAADERTAERASDTSIDLIATIVKLCRESSVNDLLSFTVWSGLNEWPDQLVEKIPFRVWQFICQI